jgi:hypothetical protein
LLQSDRCVTRLFLSCLFSKFAEWIRDKKLRAPVFFGLREDEKPTEVVREAERAVLREGGQELRGRREWILI